MRSRQILRISIGDHWLVKNSSYIMKYFIHFVESSKCYSFIRVKNILRSMHSHININIILIYKSFSKIPNWTFSPFEQIINFFLPNVIQCMTKVCNKYILYVPFYRGISVCMQCIRFDELWGFVENTFLKENWIIKPQRLLSAL